jgi:hypothetical protein
MKPRAIGKRAAQPARARGAPRGMVLTMVNARSMPAAQPPRRGDSGMARVNVILNNRVP